MAASTRVRAATPVDRERLVSLWIDLVEHHRRLDPGYPAAPGVREALRGEVERGLRSRSCRILVAEPAQSGAGTEGDPGAVDPGLVGFLFAEVEAPSPGAAGAGGTSWIHELYIAPEWRSRGLARALVERAQEFFDELGVGRVGVRVERANEQGLAFWRHLGFGESAFILERSS